MAIELARLLVSVGTNLSGMSKGLKQAEGMVQTSGAKMGKMFKLFSAGVAGYGAISIGKHALGLATDAEQTEVAFKTMLGSADAAKTMMQDLNQFAASTPFQLPGIQQATKMLLAYGTTQEEIMPTIKMLGDAAAGSGRDLSEVATIFGQVRAEGKLTGERLNQFQESAIPMTAELAKIFGVAESEIKQMVSEGKVGFGDVEQAFMNMTSSGGIYADMMKAQSETLGGLWSTLKDNVDQVLREMIEAILPWLKSMLKGAITVVQWFGMAFKDIGKFSKVLWESSKLYAWAFIETTIQHFKNFWEFMKAIGAAIREILIATFTGGDVIGAAKKGGSMIADAYVGGIKKQGAIWSKAVDDSTKLWLEAWTDSLENSPEAKEAGAAAALPGSKRGGGPGKKGKGEKVDARTGFAEFGQKIQDALLKKEDDKQDKMIALSEQGNKIQEQILQQLRQSEASPAVLGP